jgi:hypothetical protein
MADAGQLRLRTLQRKEEENKNNVPAKDTQGPRCRKKKRKRKIVMIKKIENKKIAKG